MDGGAVIAIGASVGPTILVMIGASYHLGSRLGQLTQNMKNYHERLSSVEVVCKDVPAMRAEVKSIDDRTVRIQDILNSRHRRKK